MNKSWCIPKVSARFVWRMEDVLDLYAEPFDARRPVVCFDEKSYQLVREVRQPVPVAPGRVARYDYEYERAGTANLFLFFAPLIGWRHVKVTERPWRLAEEDSERGTLEQTLFDLADGLRVVAIALASYLPETAARILEALGADPREIGWDRVTYGLTPARTGITAAPPLFPRIDTPTAAA